MSMLFALLLSSLANAQYRANSLILYDAKGVLGSATHVCSRDGKNLTFVTTAHEVETSACVISSDGKTQAGCLSLTNGLSFNGLPPQGRAVMLAKIDSSKDIAILQTPMSIFDSALPSCVTLPWKEMSGGATPTAMDIDATINLAERSFVVEAYDANKGGMIRQEFKASIVKTVNRGLPGREGTGQLFVLKGYAIPGYSGGAVLEKDSDSLMDRYELKGIILAAGDGKVVLLPASEILTSFAAPSRVLEKKVAGGVLYVNEKAVHYRSAVSEAGSGRTSDGGSGRTSDGSTSLVAARFGSGIAFLNMPNRRWLSISDYWSEAEPFPLERRGDLQNPARLEGIFEENGQLFVSSAASPLPRFLMNIEGCETQKAIAHTLGGKKSQREVTVCNSTNANESVFSVSVDGVTYKIYLQKNCSGGSGVCPITRSAVRSSRGNSTELQMDGLRTVFDGANRMTVEYSGGYVLKLGSMKLVGPSL